MSATLFAACQPEIDDHCTIALSAPLEPDDAPVERGWCPDVVPTLVIDSTAPCPLDAVQEALDFWSAHGYAFHVRQGERPDEDEREYGHVYLSQGDPGEGFDGMTGAVNTRTKALEVVSIVVRDCIPIVLAHELGHALGFGHSSSPELLMYPEALHWQLRESELSAMDKARSQQP